MKQKTAMQELKEKLQIVVDDLHNCMVGTSESGYCLAMQNVIKDIDAQMLQFEREQIEAAFKSGNYNFNGQGLREFKDGHDYYQQKYGDEPIIKND